MSFGKKTSSPSLCSDETAEAKYYIVRPFAVVEGFWMSRSSGKLMGARVPLRAAAKAYVPDTCARLSKFADMTLLLHAAS